MELILLSDPSHRQAEREVGGFFSEPAFFNRKKSDGSNSYCYEAESESLAEIPSNA